MMFMAEKMLVTSPNGCRLVSFDSRRGLPQLPASRLAHQRTSFPAHKAASRRSAPPRPTSRWSTPPVDSKQLPPNSTFESAVRHRRPSAPHGPAQTLWDALE